MPIHPLPTDRTPINVERILVPVAPGQAHNERFHQVFAFANRWAAKVTLLTVVEDLTAVRVAKHANLPAWQLLKQAEEAERQSLEQLAEHLKQSYSQIEFEVQVRAGIAFLEIIHTAVKGRFDLIAIDANRGHKRHAARYGSTTRHLMRKSPTPVWTTAVQGSSEIRRIAAAVDVGAPTEQGKQLNHQIVEYAATMAKQYQAELYLFHAWQLLGESLLRSWGNQSDLQIAQWSQQERNERDSMMMELVESCPVEGVSAYLRLMEGSLELLLPDFIRTERMDLLVMGTLCRTGIAGFIIGNTAESVLDSVQCSVITLKPEGFESPVRV